MRWKLGIFWLLWMATAASTLGAAIGPASGAEIGGEVGTMLETAARRGDVLALMSACTLGSITFSAWLVRQLLSRITDTTAAINRLVSELAGRPCIGPKAVREFDTDRLIKHHE